MDTGKLKHRIALIPPGSPSKDDDGFNTTPAGTPVYVWAAKAVLSGKEVHETGRDVGTQLVRYTIRYRPGLTSHFRIIDGGVDLNIIEPPADRDGEHQWIDIVAEAVK